MVFAALLAGLLALVWASIRPNRSHNEIYASFFLTVATSWVILAGAKLWITPGGDSWGRRIVMMILGAGVGFLALWLEGWTPSPILHDLGHESATELPVNAGMKNISGTICYFALALFAMRWWRLAERRRTHRFSFGPVLAAAFWGWVLLFVWNEPLKGTLVLATSAAIVQMVSPWQPPPPRVPRRVRLRYA